MLAARRWSFRPRRRARHGVHARPTHARTLATTRSALLTNVAKRWLAFDAFLQPFVDLDAGTFVASGDDLFGALASAECAALEPFECWRTEIDVEEMIDARATSGALHACYITAGYLVRTGHAVLVDPRPHAALVAAVSDESVPLYELVRHDAEGVDGTVTEAAAFEGKFVILRELLRARADDEHERVQLLFKLFRAGSAFDRVGLLHAFDTHAAPSTSLLEALLTASLPECYVPELVYALAKRGALADGFVLDHTRFAGWTQNFKVMIRYWAKVPAHALDGAVHAALTHLDVLRSSHARFMCAIQAAMLVNYISESSAMLIIAHLVDMGARWRGGNLLGHVDNDLVVASLMLKWADAEALDAVFRALGVTDLVEPRPTRAGDDERRTRAARGGAARRARSRH